MFPAMLPYTRSILFLDDHEWLSSRVTAFGSSIRPGEAASRNSRTLPGIRFMAEKGGYKHFMLKEIYEQPSRSRNTILGRFSLDTNTIHLEDVAFTMRCGRASGTSGFWLRHELGTRRSPDNT